MFSKFRLNYNYFHDYFHRCISYDLKKQIELLDTRLIFFLTKNRTVQACFRSARTRLRHESDGNRRNNSRCTLEFELA